MRICQWCDGPIPSRARGDAIYCSKSCRQAAHRFRRGGEASAIAATDEPLRLAYADPPYPGKAGIYRDHPDYAGEVDHRELVDRLVDEFPDGWALSTSAAALRDVWTLTPPETRLAIWHRDARPTRSRFPLRSYEPVLFFRGRQIAPDRGATDRVDVFQYVPRARLTDPRHVTGAKPSAFCYWLFTLLGARAGDELVDLYPGSGGVSRAWSIFTTGRPGPDDAKGQLRLDALRVGAGPGRDA